MSWQPEEQTLRQLAQCLKDSLGGHDPNARKNAELVRQPQLCLVLTRHADFDAHVDA
jgi:hypothetical protein